MRGGFRKERKGEIAGNGPRGLCKLSKASELRYKQEEYKQELKLWSRIRQNMG